MIFKVGENHLTAIERKSRVVGATFVGATAVAPTEKNERKARVYALMRRKSRCYVCRCYGGSTYRKKREKSSHIRADAPEIKVLRL
ncbi:hypothetical protein CR203_05840 [Salipaludibacillus neizhouensis]|uniref:Uncharacterized protein n=1 Tax=Salipaludibacillus neizhouensis TaxID=885475 RepID=A0A3A9KBW7_9BACI|nr:hypothetical protein CR203_05840 [Salipaludibacillus neizhouensis]